MEFLTLNLTILQKSEKMKIQGSVAIVTGGAQGIGEKICAALLDRGCKVILVVRSSMYGAN